MARSLISGFQGKTGFQLLRVVCGREQGHQAVIVALRDRVELVRVAAGAIHRQGKQAAPQHFDRVVSTP